MIYNYIVPKYCYNECQRTSLHPSIKTFVAICLSNINTRSLTLGHVLNSFLLNGSVSVHVCFISLLKVIFYIVRCSLVTPTHVFFYTVNTLPPALNNCYYLLYIIIGVTVVPCYNISCSTYCLLLQSPLLLFFHCFFGVMACWHSWPIVTLTLFTAEVLTLLACWLRMC